MTKTSKNPHRAYTTAWARYIINQFAEKHTLFWPCMAYLTVRPKDLIIILMEKDHKGWYNLKKLTRSIENGEQYTFGRITIKPEHVHEWINRELPF